MKRTLYISLVSAALILAAACAEEDTEAPAPPMVDELASPTPEAEPMVTGTAEFGSTVRISGGAATVETTADPYTARFAIRVPLDTGDNMVSVTAIDAAGNESEATVVTVAHVLPGETPAQVLIDGPVSARAGEPVTFEVIALDVYGDPIEPPPVMLTTDAPAGTTTFQAPATYTFCDLGTWTVTAEAGPGGPSASTVLEVVAGKPIAVDLTTTPSPAVITAGETVAYQTSAMDTCGNATGDVVEVYTNAPGAIAAGGTISGLVRAGSYVIVAEVPGSGLSDSETLLVNADETSVAVVLSLSTHNGFVGIPVGYTVTAVDGFGNPVLTPPAITVPTDPGATVETLTQTIAFSTPGSHTVIATVAGASDSDFILVNNADLTAPTVAIVSPAPGTVYGPGDTVTVVVETTDDQGLAQILFQASGEADTVQTRLVPFDAQTGSPQTSYTTTFVFEIPGGAGLGDVLLVAQAIDTAGRHTSSPEMTIRVDPAANLVVAAGFSAETVASRGAYLRGPRGITVDAAGAIYVANNGADVAVVQIDPLSGEQTVFTPSITNAGPEDIVFHAGTGNLFLTARGTNRLYRIDSLGLSTAFTANLGSQPHAVIADSNNEITAIWADGWIRRFNPAASPLAAPTFSTHADFVGGAWGLAQWGADYVLGDRADDQLWTVTPGADLDPVGSATLLVGAPPLDVPLDIVMGPGGDALYLANEGDGRLLRVDLANCIAFPCPTSTIAVGFNSIWGLTFDASGDLLITDEGNDVVYRMTGAF